jgi:hypothetical protein
MANQVTTVYQKNGNNFKTTSYSVALSGNYAAPESVDLRPVNCLNPQAQPITGPNGTPPIPPRVTALQVGGGGNGYVAQLKATATAGVYNMTLIAGPTAFNGAYTAGDFVTIEVDHALQGL